MLLMPLRREGREDYNCLSLSGKAGAGGDWDKRGRDYKWECRRICSPREDGRFTGSCPLSICKNEYTESFLLTRNSATKLKYLSHFTKCVSSELGS